jgi:hypothetical protein
VRRITKAALGGLAGCALVLGGTQLASGAVVEYTTSGPLVQIPPPATWAPLPSDGAFDAAEATLRIKYSAEASNFKLTVTNIDPAAGLVHGAHLHNGPCDPLGSADTTSTHYKANPSITGAEPENEVWFDLVPNDHDPATATDSTTAQFVPVDNDGAMSIVIHARSADLPTAQSAKLVCLNLVVTGEGDTPDWFPEVP